MWIKFKGSMRETLSLLVSIVLPMICLAAVVVAVMFIIAFGLAKFVMWSRAAL